MPLLPGECMIPDLSTLMVSQEARMTLLHEREFHSGKLRDISEHPISRRAMLRRASLLGLSATGLAGTGALAWPGGLVAANQESQPVRGGVVRVGVPGSAASFDGWRAYFPSEPVRYPAASSIRASERTTSTGRPRAPHY